MRLMSHGRTTAWDSFSAHGYVIALSIISNMEGIIPRMDEEGKL